MEHSATVQANDCSAGEEVSHLLWNLKFHYLVHKSLPLDHVLSQMNPVHTLTLYFLKFHVMLSFHLHLDLQSGNFPSG